MISHNKGRFEWAPQEQDLLKYYQPKFKSKKWKNISNQLKKKGFHRSQTQCRERWINFLDPKANKNKWEKKQLKHLYDTYQQVGTKWCFIQKGLNRTQNSIKNRFYGTLRNIVRFVLSYFDSRRTCYNREISRLSPKFLTDLYNSQNEFQFMKGEVRAIIYEMDFIVNKKVMVEYIKKQRKMYQKLNQLILSTFEEMMTLNGYSSILDDERSSQEVIQESIAQKIAEEPEPQENKRQDTSEVKKEAGVVHSMTVVQQPWTISKTPPVQMNQWFPFFQYHQMNPAWFPM